MDQRRADTVSSLLLLVIVVVLIFGVGQYYLVEREVERIQLEDSRRVIGSDRTLLETVQKLEATLRERISYRFVSNEDPLDLSKVITSREFLEKLGAGEKDPDARVMRLAATVVGEDGEGAAIIRYLGSGHVLREGDELEGWTITNISKETVTMTRGGQRQVLENRPVRETLQATGTMLSVRPMKNEDWLRSMYTNVGYPGDNSPVDSDDEGAAEDTATGDDSSQEGAADNAPGVDTTETSADTTQMGNR